MANVYYWSSERGLKQLIEHPKHLEAKRCCSEWLAGCQVVISQFIHNYGDREISHPSAIA